MSRIFVTGHNTFSGDDLVTGKYYDVYDAAEGTAAQNKAYWALLNEYFISGLFSCAAVSVNDLHKYIKRFYGAGFDCVYAIVQRKSYPNAGENKIVRFETLDEAKKEAAYFGTKQEIFGHLKSFSKYTKIERMAAIDGLIAEMKNAGLTSKKFYEILEGMEEPK